MRRRHAPLAALLATAALLTLVQGCAPKPLPGRAPLAASDLPVLPSGTEIAPGVRYSEVTLPGKEPMRLGVYLPTNAGPGRLLPCVFVAPAGTPLIYGNQFGDGSRPEHLPYARAGFAVITYDIDGATPDEPTDEQIVEAARKFMSADAGIANCRQAIDYALSKVSQVDPNRIFVAGHSSAGTLALQVAQHEPRVKACVAYAPCTDVASRLGETLDALNPYAPGFKAFVLGLSPDANADKLKCPTFLFHADDDSNVPVAESARFAEKVRKTNPTLTFVRVPTGDHYESMIDQGIPRAAEWLRGIR